jgi:hypothetical protein
MAIFAGGCPAARFHHGEQPVDRQPVEAREAGASQPGGGGVGTLRTVGGLDDALGGSRRRTQRRVDPVGHLPFGRFRSRQDGAGGFGEFDEFFFVRLVPQLVGRQVVAGKQIVHAVGFALPELGAGRAVEEDRHFDRPT